MSTILTTIRWLSILAGALSLFYLGNASFEFGLGEVFHRIHEWYVGLVHPVVGVLKPVALWLVGLLGWSLPVWWKDVVVLYLAAGAATARGTSSRILEADEGAGMWSDGARDDPEMAPEYEKVAQREVRAAARLRAIALVTAPFRVLAWPLYWLGDVAAAAWARLRFGQGALRPGARSWMRPGYVSTSTRQLLGILAGALIFAVLNAGLG